MTPSAGEPVAIQRRNPGTSGYERGARRRLVGNRVSGVGVKQGLDLAANPIPDP